MKDNNSFEVILYYFILVLNVTGHCLIWFTAPTLFQLGILSLISITDLLIYFAYYIKWLIDNADIYQMNLSSLIFEEIFSNINYQTYIDQNPKPRIIDSYLTRFYQLVLAKLLSLFVIQFNVTLPFYMSIGLSIIGWTPMGALISLSLMMVFLK